MGKERTEKEIEDSCCHENQLASFGDVDDNVGPQCTYLLDKEGQKTV
jgi:hypothetical protein